VAVVIHETIETKGMTKEDVPVLRDRVRALVEAPVEARLAERGRVRGES
jgi:hypothetical protein